MGGMGGVYFLKLGEKVTDFLWATSFILVGYKAADKFLLKGQTNAQMKNKNQGSVYWSHPVSFWNRDLDPY